MAFRAGVLACVGQLAAAQNGRKPEDVPLPAGVGVDWWQSVQADIAQSEYAVTWQDTTPHVDLAGAYQAPNRAQNFRTYFAPEGIRLIPRTTSKDEAPAWEFGLSLTAWGRDGALEPVEPAMPHTHGNRVEYERGGVVEWYVNEAKGLEQGFTIERDPAPDARDTAGSFLSLQMAVTGDLAADVDDCAEVADFLAPGGALAIRLDKLHVLDASGRDLPAWFEVSVELTHAASQSLSIVVDDRGAVYPVTIDPLATSPSWTAESNQIGARFGYATSTAGDVNGDGFSDVLVGAPFFDNGETDEGAAWLYFGSSSGLAAGAPWSAEGNQAGACFGYSVATAGDVNADGYCDVLIGAPFFDNGQANEGAAWLYLGSAGGLAAGALWSAESNQAMANFGISVAAAGDVNGDGYSDALIGAWTYDNGQTDEGAAWLYLGSASGLAAGASWSAESNQASAFFGYSTSTAGDVNGDGYSDVIVGAYAFDNGEANEGAAWLYFGSASGLAAGAPWSAEGNQVNASFGYSVSTAGDVNGDGYADVIVGAPYYANGQTEEGGAFVYLGSPGGLAASYAWHAEMNQTYTNLGMAVATAGDVNGDGYSDVTVGASAFDNGQSDEGLALVYHGSAGGLPAGPAWFVESNQAGANFGISVAAAGDVNGDGYSDVIVGAYSFDFGQSDEGRAYVYHGASAGLTTLAGWAGGTGQSDGEFGHSVSTAGDVNGDGYSDVVVGAMRYDNGQSDEGRAFVYHGSGVGLSTVADWWAESNQASGWFGVSVATAGDVNGDGYSDVIVGAHGYSNGQNDEGRAFVYPGSEGGLSGFPDWTMESDQVGAWFGYSVATAGDLNGDGYGDVIVGAPYHSSGEYREGRAFVYLGSSTGLEGSAAWIAESNQVSAYFGTSVSSAGDIDGDGYSDVIVGSPACDVTHADEGRAFVYCGSPCGVGASAAWMAEPGQAGAWFGFSVSTAGDVNGDGYSDVIVGALTYDNGQMDEGAAFVYHGAASGLGASAAWTAESDQASALFGYSVSTAGDVNGDGYSDVIVGAELYDGGGNDSGGAFAYQGSPAGLAAGSTWSATSLTGGARFGHSVSAAGDVNGDGYSDVIVGALFDHFSSFSDGRATLHYGNGDAGVPVRLRQRRADNSAPIGPLGVAAVGSFRARLVGRSAFGRGDGAVAVELKSLGTPFDNLGLVTTPLMDFGFGGVDTGSILSLPAPATAYHWRARVVHSRVTTPWLPAGPWFSTCVNAATETDVRTPGPSGGGVGFCTAGTTSSGCTALISGAGNASASAGSGFTISVATVEGGQNGILFYGVSGSKVDPWGTGTSILCVKSPFERMGVQVTGGTAGACNGAMSIDWNQYVVTHSNVVGAPFVGGETVWAQAWFRDPPSPKTTSLSNGLQFTVCP